MLGVKTLDDVYRVAPQLSLEDKGLLDKPSAPLFIVNGKLDDQAPIADSYLLMEHGSPKEVRILATTIANWLKLRLGQ